MTVLNCVFYLSLSFHARMFMALRYAQSSTDSYKNTTIPDKDMTILSL
jgi:hypothetical protein